MAATTRPPVSSIISQRLALCISVASETMNAFPPLWTFAQQPMSPITSSLSSKTFVASFCSNIQRVRRGISRGRTENRFSISVCPHGTFNVPKLLVILIFPENRLISY
ncbi:hypothetical protein ACKS0A_08260 [Histoplasma ohiense]